MSEGKALGFLNIYKFISALVIVCFLHYSIFVLNSLGEMFNDVDRISFLMANTSNYLVELFFMMSGVAFAVAYKDRIG